MRRTWRLTRHAEVALADIALWTVENFGERQAEIYEQALIERCRAVADGTAQSRSCAALADGPVAQALRFTRAGSHFIVYVDGEDGVVIVDFLHGRSDLPAKLAYLSEQAKRGRR